ncbi:hypothetical protein Slala02_35080 [Streptomyces lavendulae subsp. lavendulae]|nr:hypothetical protein Slala01_35220 [Streptomyces lavendulae subsp. lavendulae]GLX27688.1 hypothetical protein Slala02_35080 [Streptomyces lavendulae subsp. lavendulae]
MANIRWNYFRPAATCGIGAFRGRPRAAVGGGERHPESAIRDFSPGQSFTVFSHGAHVSLRARSGAGRRSAGWSPLPALRPFPGAPPRTPRLKLPQLPLGRAPRRGWILQPARRLSAPGAQRPVLPAPSALEARVRAAPGERWKGG